MALGAVDDGELGVQTQVNEHATDCRSRRSQPDPIGRPVNRYKNSSCSWPSDTGKGLF